MNIRNFKKTIFIKKGRLRKDVFEKLNEPKTATELSKEMKKHRSSISRIILDLEREGFVKCINPEDDRFRYYVKK